MNFYIILDESAFSKLPEYIDVTLIIDDAIVIPDSIKNKFNIIPIQSVSKKIDRYSCQIFTAEFEKNNSFKQYSSVIEPHINDIYEYVLSSINNILFTIDRTVSKNDTIHLFGGNYKVKIGASYAIKSPEFNKNVFFNREDVLNPFLFEALKNSNKKVSYHEDNFIYTIAKYACRVLLLSCYSLVFTLKKYIVGCIKTTIEQGGLSSKITEEYILFPVRSNPQFDFVDSIARSLVASNIKAKPLIIYYEMLMGGSFYNRLKNAPYLYLSLFKYKYIPLLLLLPISIIIDTSKGYLFLRKRPNLNILSNSYSYTLPLSFLVFENLAAPHIYFYKKLLDKVTYSLKMKKRIHGICSTEMIGRQSFMERSVAKKGQMKIVNIQTSVVYDNYYPIKVVGDNIFCLSKNFANNFNKAGINNKGRARFIGQLKYISSSTNKNNKAQLIKTILYASQPYEPKLSCQFLAELSCWLNDNMNSVQLKIRLHPRDNISHYSALKNIAFVSANETIEESIRTASLVLTRTSSVVLDAIGYKVPYFICKLSEFDLNIDLDFLKSTSFSIYTSKELIDKLMDFDNIIKKHQEHIETQENNDDDAFYSHDESISLFFSSFIKTSSSKADSTGE